MHEIDGCVRAVFNREDKNIEQFADVIAKAAHSPNYFNTLSVGSVWFSNPPTESTGEPTSRTNARF